MYVEDAVDLMYACAHNDEVFGDVYFAVHREHYAVKQIAETILEVFGTGSLKQIPWPDVRKRIEIDNVVISGAKLFYKMKWEPRYTLRTGLQRTKEIYASRVGA